MHATCVFADFPGRWEDHGPMTKEQAVYAATLNLIGSDVLDPAADAGLADALGREARNAAHSTGPHIDCAQDGCWWTTPYGTRTDGDHFADLWEHMITRHGFDIRLAELPALRAWNRRTVAA